MSEQEIREGMLLAVWDEPPLDFDPDTLIRRVEQKKSRRRALVGVGVATAMIAVVSFALPGLLPRTPDGSQLASEGQTSTTLTTPSLSVYDRDQRIGDALTAKLQKVRPNLTEVYASFGWSGTGFKPEAPMQPYRPNTRDMYGFVYFTDSIGPTSLLVTTGPTAEVGQLCAGQALFCRHVQRDGSLVIEAEFQEGPEIVKAVSMRKIGDGTRAVVISSYSHNPATSTGYRQMIPVSVDVLTALATDPGIHWE